MADWIIVSEHGDIEIFDSKEAAELSMEIPDVLNEEFEIFDIEGKLMRATPFTKSATGFLRWVIRTVDAVQIDYVPEGTVDEGRLRSLLTDFLVKTRRSSEDLSLKSLAQLAIMAR